MIYSKFGSKLTLITKTETAGGRVSVQATTDGTTDIHDYNVIDLKADDGMNEINAAVSQLPLKVFENTQRGPKKFR
jgi:hypothetical protein